jgi:sporulation protein YlmC with PRC-barrel domain
MARHASIGTMIATTALIAWPVLAQTTTGPATGSPPPPGMTSPRAASPGMGAAGPAATATPSAPKYFTADHQMRASKVVGASVYNDKNEAIGSVDDVLMSDGDHKAGTAVISVGGFLGMGSKLVSVPGRPTPDRERPDHHAGRDEGVPGRHGGVSLHQCVIAFGAVHVLAAGQSIAPRQLRHDGCCAHDGREVGGDEPPIFV